MLLKNISCAYTLDDDKRILRDAWIEIEDQQIKSLGVGQPPAGASDPSIDLGGCVVCPGFINLHHHFFQSVTRASKGVDRTSSLAWLAHHYLLWARLQPEDYAAATKLAVTELLLSGCTTAVDHAYLLTERHEETLAAEIETAADLGIRLHLVRGCLPALEVDLEQRLGPAVRRIIDPADTLLRVLEDDIREHHDESPFSMLTLSLGPTTATYARPQLMSDIAALARQYWVGLHTHYHPRPAERALAADIAGMSPLAFLENTGWLTSRTFLAHCTQLNDEEIGAFAAHDVAIVHCPRTILRLGYPMTRIADMHKGGIRIGLGVDGAASNDGGSFIGEIRLALLLHRLGTDAGADPEHDWLATDDLLYMATRGAAEILGRADIGYLAPGMAADLTAFSLNRPASAGVADNPLGALFLAGNDGPAELTMVNGKVVVRNGKLVGFDETEIARAANRSAQRLSQ